MDKSTVHISITIIDCDTFSSLFPETSATPVLVSKAKVLLSSFCIIEKIS